MLPSMVNKEVNKIAKITVPIYKEHHTLRAKVISQVNDVVANHIPSQVDSLLRNYMSNNILHVHPTQTAQATAQEQQYQLYLTMKNDEQLQQQDLPIWLSLKIKFEGITTATTCHPSAIRTRDHDDYQDDDARPEGKSYAKRKKTSKNGTYSVDEFDAWMEDAGTDDDEVPDDKISQELMDEMSEEIDEAKLKKVEREVGSTNSKKKVRVVFSCQRDPKAPPLTLMNQDLFYLKHRDLGPNKYTLSIHKFPAVLFPDDDMEERTSRWVDKRLKKFNKVNLTAPTITFSGIEEYELFNIHSEPVCRMIYENNKKEKRVMVHKEIHKFCDATLKRVLEGFKKYNKDVKYGYANPSSSKDHVELLRYYEEDIRECLKHQDQMRR
ncbi:hypothetical protein Tco_0468865 [Tanacetum coccineum]